MVRLYSFTRRVRHCIGAAREEAHRLGHDAVGTEHLLLGVLAVPGALAPHLAGVLHLDAASLRADIERLAGRGRAAPETRADIPYTPGAKRALEHAMDEAVRLEADEVDAEHLLLGLVAEGSGIAAEVLRTRGCELESLRELIARARPVESPPEPSLLRRFLARLHRGEDAGTTMLLILGLLLSTAAKPVAAQGVGAGAGAACDYRACALGIAPTWNGLAVVRGIDGPRVANLNFFWPRDISVALVGGSAAAAGVDSAVAQGKRAVRIRRMGAFLTDAGILLAAGAAVRAVGRGRVERGDAVLAGSGAAALGLSVPFQFAADGALSRAVWWHNLRFGARR